MSNDNEGDLRVWWIQNPPNEAEFFPVATVEDAVGKLLKLAQVDIENPYIWGNIGGLVVFEDGEWTEWYDDEHTDIDEIVSERYFYF